MAAIYSDCSTREIIIIIITTHAVFILYIMLVISRTY